MYDKRNVEGISNVRKVVLSELERRVKGVFTHAEVRVCPIMGNSSINSNASKSDKAKLNTVIQEMFNEADMGMSDVKRPFVAAILSHDKVN